MTENNNFTEEGKWAFNKSVASVFDDMLGRSIPQYEVMRSLVKALGTKVINSDTDGDILELGCSNGLNLASFTAEATKANKCILGVDCSEAMLEDAKLRYKTEIANKVLAFKYVDLRNTYPKGNYCLVMSILTLQFTPIEYRQEILFNIYNSLPKGGVFLLVEKVLGNTHEINSMLVEEYYKLKNKNGYSYEEINEKRVSLEGVLVPVTSSWNKELLHQVGFTKIDTFWKCLNFEGYLAIK